MPGRQLAIDSDLSSGAITHDQAKARRETEHLETTFYGSLDGASKFVKGDALAGLLIQQVAPLNKALPVITFNSELEHMLIKMAKQNGDEGLVLDNELATKLISNISDLNQKLTSEGNTAVLVVSPNIRRQISAIIRQHVEDLIVLAFTELPDNRKVNVVATADGET